MDELSRSSYCGISAGAGSEDGGKYLISESMAKRPITTTEAIVSIWDRPAPRKYINESQ